MKSGKTAIAILILLGLLCFRPVEAQIEFHTYSDYDLTIGQHNDLDFGELVPDEGERQIHLGDPGTVVIPITGVASLDVQVSILPDDYLTLDAENQIPLTINAAYANRGEESVAHAELINGNEAVFPIRQREDGPPRPPATPPHDGYEPPEETAYLYIYGSINVGNVSGGDYSATVTINVNYY